MAGQFHEEAIVATQSGEDTLPQQIPNFDVTTSDGTDIPASSTKMSALANNIIQEPSLNLLRRTSEANKTLKLKQVLTNSCLLQGIEHSGVRILKRKGVERATPGGNVLLNHVLRKGRQLVEKRTPNGNQVLRLIAPISRKPTIS